jgi:hypothetical protein
MLEKMLTWVKTFYIVRRELDVYKAHVVGLQQLVHVRNPHYRVRHLLKRHSRVRDLVVQLFEVICEELFLYIFGRRF